LFLAVIILGSFFALLIVGIQSISVLVGQMRANQADQNTRQLQAPPDPNSPIDAQIAQREGQLNALSSDVAKGQEARQIAVLYERNGRMRLQSGDFEGAEQSFQGAIEKDPENPALRTNLAALYGEVAGRTRYPDQAVPLWNESAAYWSQAADLEAGSDRKASFRNAAAQALYQSAELLIDAGKRSDARLALYDARRLVAPGSPAEDAVLKLLEDLGG